jgi:hypothetical protein
VEVNEWQTLSQCSPQPDIVSVVERDGGVSVPVAVTKKAIWSQLVLIGSVASRTWRSGCDAEGGFKYGGFEDALGTLKWNSLALELET